MRAVIPVVVAGWMVVDSLAWARWLASWLVAIPLLIVTAIVIGAGYRSAARYLAYAAVSTSFAVWMLYDGRWRIDAFHVRTALWTAGEALIVLAFIATRLARLSFLPALALALEGLYYFLSVYAGLIGDQRLMWIVFAIAVVLANAAKLDQPTSGGPGSDGVARTGTVV